jgi:ABC-type Fe3+ transport system permease subunit
MPTQFCFVSLMCMWVTLQVCMLHLCQASCPWLDSVDGLLGCLLLLLLLTFPVSYMVISGLKVTTGVKVLQASTCLGL